MICLISDQSNEPTKNLKSLNRLIENRNSKLYTKWLKGAETLRVELCGLMKLEQVSPPPLLLSKPTSPLFNWKDPYWQCLITIQWTQSRYEGSLRSSVSPSEKEMRNLENWGLVPDSGDLAPAPTPAPVVWCDCKIRRVHVSNNGIPSHYSDDSRWKGNLINSPARCSAVHNVSLNRTPLVGVRGTQINIQMSLVVAERPPSPLIPTYDNLIYDIMWLFMSQWHQWHVWGLPINFLSTT